MAFFSKGSKKEKNDREAERPNVAPPLFNKHADHVLLKGHNPGRNMSLGGSAPALGVSSRRRSRLGSTGGHSSINFGMSSFKSDETAAEKKAKNASSRASVSYIEEILEDLSYEEEIIEEEYFEEIIEFVEDDLPEREIKIKFDDFDEMQTTLHINDYSTLEVGKAWYNRSDYDKMVEKARLTVAKAEGRSGEVAASPKDKKKKKDKVKEKGKDSNETATESTKKKAVDTRGLEAWSTSGVTKTRVLKESAIEAVWNEQNRQWTTGDTDVEKIREAYRTVSSAAQEVAQVRAEGDQAAAENIRTKEREEVEKKKNRRVLGKSKALLGKSVRATTGSVKKTSKIVGMTKRVALKASKKVARTAVATATLDRKMLKEELTGKKKQNNGSDRQITRQPSRGAHHLFDTGLGDSGSVGSLSLDDLSVTTETKKKHQLKLLGVIPIPGSSKMYKEDLEQKKIEARRSKMSRMPSWESGLKSGKY